MHKSIIEAESAILKYWPGVEKRRNLTSFLGGHPPPRPPQLVGLEASKIFHLYWKSNTNRPFWKPPGRLIGGSGGPDAPPGIKLSCVFAQPRASRVNAGTSDSHAATFFAAGTTDEYGDKQSRGYASQPLPMPCELAGSKDMSNSPCEMDRSAHMSVPQKLGSSHVRTTYRYLL